MTKNTIITITYLFILLFFAWPGFADTLENGDIGEKIRQPVRESVEIRKQTQKANEQWQKEKQVLASRYDRLQEENKRLAARRDALEENLEATTGRVRRKEKQLADIEQVTGSMAPFLTEMIGRLARLPDEGMPFLKEERARRIQRLREMMSEPDVDASEKYRKVMEALLVEAEYGNTIEVYQETIDVSGRSILANIFRLGRISLFYQTMDQQESGWYDMAAGAWEKLPERHNRAISTAIDIGAKRQPVELVTLPLGRLVVK
ncbi:MAG: DUF3450 domain-containing protein [Desulfosalsimonadaceae bacterium]